LAKNLTIHNFFFFLDSRLPQAVCTRWGLAIGARMSPLVWFLIVVMSPIAWPMAKLLDVLLGHSTGTFFRRAELKELLLMHSESQRAGDHAAQGGGKDGGGRDGAAASAAGPETLTDFECSVVAGAMDLRSKNAVDVMTPIASVCALSEEAVLDGDTMADVLRFGHSRIPVHSAGDPTMLKSILLGKGGIFLCLLSGLAFFFFLSLEANFFFFLSLFFDWMGLFFSPLNSQADHFPGPRARRADAHDQHAPNPAR
jgi:hypothetical protein